MGQPDFGTAHDMFLWKSIWSKIFISDPMACDLIWFIGDNFIATTYPKGMQSEDTFVKENFGTLAFHNDQHFDQNLSSRLRNTLVAALNKHDNRLPKLIVFALDNDMIKFLDHEEYGASLALGKIMDSLIGSVNEVVKARIDQLATKCIRDKEPHFIWIGAPIHQDFTDNSQRIKLK